MVPSVNSTVASPWLERTELSFLSVHPCFLNILMASLLESLFGLLCIMIHSRSMTKFVSSTFFLITFISEGVSSFC